VSVVQPTLELAAARITYREAVAGARCRSRLDLLCEDIDVAGPAVISLL
jgi:hypothetical protein